MRTCAIQDCQRKPVARRWCASHYRRWRDHGDPLGGLHFRTGCSVKGCPDKHAAKRYCAKHYQRFMKYGDPQYLASRDVDDVAVLRAVQGDRPARMTPAEREAAVRRLHAQRMTDRLIGEQIGLGASGVWTIRQRLGLPPNATPSDPFAGRRAA